MGKTNSILELPITLISSLEMPFFADCFNNINNFELIKTNSSIST